MQRSNSPLPEHDAQSNARGMPRGVGGMLKFRIDWRISLTNGQMKMYPYKEDSLQEELPGF